MMTPQKKKGVALLVVAGAVILASRAKASTSARRPALPGRDDPEDDRAPPPDPDLCSNNARRRDMTHMHNRMDELVDVESTGSQERLHPEAAVAYNRMRDDARRAGFAAPLFSVVSGYRTLATQTRLFTSQKQKQRELHPGWSEAQIEEAARVWVAAPGSSDHETGCAVDLYLGYPIQKSSNGAIRDSAPYRWLAENAWRYGFCEYAYVSPNKPGEAWHWKYILQSVR